MVFQTIAYINGIFFFFVLSRIWVSIMLASIQYINWYIISNICANFHHGRLICAIISQRAEMNVVSYKAENNIPQFFSVEECLFLRWYLAPHDASLIILTKKILIPVKLVGKKLYLTFSQARTQGGGGEVGDRPPLGPNVEKQNPR